MALKKVQFSQIFSNVIPYRFQSEDGTQWMKQAIFKTRIFYFIDGKTYIYSILKQVHIFKECYWGTFDLYGLFDIPAILWSLGELGHIYEVQKDFGNIWWNGVCNQSTYKLVAPDEVILLRNASRNMNVETYYMSLSTLDFRFVINIRHYLVADICCSDNF